jgi:uncharacterized protein (AIM24 family)
VASAWKQHPLVVLNTIPLLLFSAHLQGETMVLDTNCLLAYSESCTFDLKRTAGIVGMFGGGEGIFNSTITGPGLAIVQSMNKKLLIDSLMAHKMIRR